MAVDGILVQISFGMGNAIMKVPMLLALRRLYPEKRIDVWCDNGVADVTLEGLREHWYQSKSLFNIFKRRDDIGGAHTLAIITSPQDETFRRSVVATKYIEHTEEKLKLFKDRHEVEVNMDLVRQLGYKGLTPATRIFIPVDVQQKIDKWLLKKQFSKYRAVVAIHNGSLDTDIWKLKRWSKGRLVELVREMKKNNILPIMIGTDKDTTIEEKEVLNFTNKMTIKETAAVLSRCSLLVSTDSGPAHLADAVDTPTIVLFGPTYKSKNIPFNQGRAISLDLDCQPCYWTKRMDECKKSICMENITVDMIMEKILKRV